MLNYYYKLLKLKAPLKANGNIKQSWLSCTSIGKLRTILEKKLIGNNYIMAINTEVLMTKR